MDAGTISALIAAVASLVVAGIAFRASQASATTARQASNELAKLTAVLTNETDERRARRDYEYEARKRLYTEIEPLMFQLRRASSLALDRIRNLAVETRKGNLDGDKSWLLHDGYYVRSTMYRILAPAVLAELIQRKMTLVDLGLDPLIAREYEITRAIASALLRDWDLAADPKLDYDPDDTPSGHGIEPGLDAVHRRQGVYTGWLEDAVDAMIINDDGRARLLRFGEFSALLDDDPRGDDLAAYLCRDPDLKDVPPVARLRYLFDGFHPVSAPVLWRVLVFSATVYLAVTQRHDGDAADAQAFVHALSEAERKRLDCNEDEVGGAVAVARVLLDSFPRLAAADLHAQAHATPKSTSSA